MKKLLLIASYFLFSIGYMQGQVAINTNGSIADSSAMLDVKSTTKGLLIPRLTLLQRKAILLPATGLMVFQTDGSASGFYFFDGSFWQWLGGSNLTGSGNNGRVAFWTGTGSLASNDQLFWDNLNSRLGIGTTSPGQSLSIFNGNIELKNNSVSANELRFHEPGFAGGGNYTAIKARPQAGDVTYTLPSADGSDNQALVTDGSGALSWLTTELPLTFTNGINRTTNSVKLGGSLTENTTITQDAAETLTFSNTGTGNTTFNLVSTGDFHIEDNGVPFFTATSGGRIGIGNPNPLQKFTVGGTIGIIEGGASPTHHTIFQGGVQAADITYTLPVDNGNSGEMLTTDGTGVLSWNPAESPLTFSNGLTRSGNTVKLGGALTGNTSITQGGNSLTVTNDGTANTAVNLTGTGDFRVEKNGAAFFTATDGGNVGVGIANPAQKLTVNGTLGIMESSVPPVYSTILAGGNQTSDIYYSLPVNVGVNGQALVTDGVGMLRWETTGNLFGSGSAGKIPFWTSSNMMGYNNTFAWDNTNGRLGIGTTSPDQQLELTGNLMLPVTTASTGIIYAGAKPFIHNFGTRNVFLGKGAGNLTQSATQDNIGIGDSTLLSLTSGDYNIAIGTSGLRSLTSANGNTVVGYDAGLNLQNDSYNTIYGYRAGMHNITDRSAFFGCEAGFSNTTGPYNTFLGHGAGNKNTTGGYSVAVGYKALFTQTGDEVDNILSNTAIGYQALYSCNSTNPANGRYNVGVGREALSSLTTGSSNTVIGTCNPVYLALTTGNGNTLIGYNIAANSYTSSTVAIGSECVLSNDQSVAIGANCDVIGPNSIGIGYGVNVNTNNKAIIGNASVTTIGGYGAWTNYSDKRHKENIRYRSEPGLNFILKLKPASYNYIKDENKRRRDGLIAQDVQATLQELGIEFSGLVIDNDKEATLNLAYSEFVIPLINAIQEQQKMIEKQQAMITELTSRATGQQSAMAELRSQVEMLLKNYDSILQDQRKITADIGKNPENKTVVGLK